MELCVTYITFDVPSGHLSYLIWHSATYWHLNCLYRPFQMQAWSCITSYPLQGLPYLAYDNVNPAMVNSMMLRSSMLMLAFEKVYWWLVKYIGHLTWKTYIRQISDYITLVTGPNKSDSNSHGLLHRHTIYTRQSLNEKQHRPTWLHRQ